LFQSTNKRHKISDSIIDQIRNVILSGQLKPGEKIASEKELLAQFGVSKATLREALRVLETMGLVEIKKGVAGGVFIAEVDMKTTLHSITHFLQFKEVSIKDITMVRYLLEPPVALIAASRIQPEDIEKLETMIADRPTTEKVTASRDIGFHRYLARMTGNPILILMMDFIDNMLNDIKFKVNLGNEFYQQVSHDHRSILECLKQKDGEGAKREIINDLLKVGDYLAKVTESPSFDSATIPEDHLMHRPFQGPILQNGSPGEEVLSFKDLGEIFEKEIADKHLTGGSFFKKIGTGELYFISLSDKDHSNKTEP
jgi:GntR family transcriptional repressor for pyruvate dehydrogenase complex